LDALEELKFLAPPVWATMGNKLTEVEPWGA
jgi:hypothetical protein